MKNIFRMSALALSLSGLAAYAAGTTTLATATLEARSGSKVSGTVNFNDVGGGEIEVVADLAGLGKSGKHGFHIHEKGDCSAADASSAGGHFNPGGQPHGAAHAKASHRGDLGNVTAGADGKAHYSARFPRTLVEGPDSVVGKAVIVHSGEDDLKSQPSGDAGGRVACGVIRSKR